jgi:hypothetical protein
MQITTEPDYKITVSIFSIDSFYSFCFALRMKVDQTLILDTIPLREADAKKEV